MSRAVTWHIFTKKSEVRSERATFFLHFPWLLTNFCEGTTERVSAHLNAPQPSTAQDGKRSVGGEGSTRDRGQPAAFLLPPVSAALRLFPQQGGERGMAPS